MCLQLLLHFTYQITVFDVLFPSLLINNSYILHISFQPTQRGEHSNKVWRSKKIRELDMPFNRIFLNCRNGSSGNAELIGRSSIWFRIFT